RKPAVRPTWVVASCWACAVAVDAVDTTGAGDAFTAALAWRLGAGATLAEAAAYAARVGAAAVTREGAQESFPTAAEVEAL
ncbi:PfkB family carbohydrate kinase, partial [Streptomyces nigra]